MEVKEDINTEYGCAGPCNMFITYCDELPKAERMKIVEDFLVANVTITLIQFIDQIRLKPQHWVNYVHKQGAVGLGAVFILTNNARRTREELSAVLQTYQEGARKLVEATTANKTYTETNLAGSDKVFTGAGVSVVLGYADMPGGGRHFLVREGVSGKIARLPVPRPKKREKRVRDI